MTLILAQIRLSGDFRRRFTSTSSCQFHLGVSPTHPMTMICHRCRSSILSRFHQHHTVAWSASSPARQLPLQRTQFRNYSDGQSSPAPSSPPKPRQPVVGDITVPSAISSATPGVSQPLSTPEEVHTDAAPEKPAKPAATHPVSSCPAGTRMTGLSFFKNKPEVFALEDSEYPDWLWTLVSSPKSQSRAKSGGVDLDGMLWAGVIYLESIC